MTDQEVQIIPDQPPTPAVPPVQPPAPAGESADELKARLAGLQRKIDKEYVPLVSQLQAAQAANTTLQQQLQALQGNSGSAAQQLETERAAAAAQLTTLQQQLQAATQLAAQRETELNGFMKRIDLSRKVAAVNPIAAQLYEKDILKIPDDADEAKIKELVDAFTGVITQGARQSLAGAAPISQAASGSATDYTTWASDDLRQWLNNPANMSNSAQWNKVQEIFLSKAPKQ